MTRAEDEDVAERRRQSRIEDVEWLLASGESRWHIPPRIGMTAPSLTKYLHRAGRPDLATLFSNIGRGTG